MPDPDEQTVKGRQEALRAALLHAEHLLKRLSEWDVMQVTADGPYWQAEIAKTINELFEARAALAALGPEGDPLTPEEARACAKSIGWWQLHGPTEGLDDFAYNAIDKLRNWLRRLAGSGGRQGER